VNPALTEPFGLTLLEAAASGLPIVATNDGGPQDILEACQNGLLVDPTDAREMSHSLHRALKDEKRWDRWSRQGLDGVHTNFSWDSHTERYLGAVKKALGGLPTEDRHLSRRRRLPRLDRVLVTDVDDTLTGDPEALNTFRQVIEGAGDNVGFAVATGRPLERALSILADLGLRTPDILITATGTEIHYGEHLIPDRSWEHQIRYRWEPDKIREVIAGMPGSSLVEESFPTPFRIRFRMTDPRDLNLAEVRRTFRRRGLQVTAILDHHSILDVTPVRASPGLAIRFICHKWNMPPDRVLVAGDSGNDADMLSGDTLGVVVGNFTPELEEIRGLPRVFFAEGEHAWGILEGITHYQFLDDILIPDEDQP
jgi:sucrose-phosphate synthase